MSGEPTDRNSVLDNLFESPDKMAERLIDALTSLVNSFRGESRFFSDTTKIEQLEGVLGHFHTELAIDTANYFSPFVSCIVTQETLHRFFRGILLVCDESQGDWVEGSQRNRIAKVFLNAIGYVGDCSDFMSFNQSHKQLLDSLLRVVPSRPRWRKFLREITHAFFLTPLMDPSSTDLIDDDVNNLNIWMGKCGPLLNSLNLSGHTPLSCAIDLGKFNLARALIMKGADPMKKAEKPYLMTVSKTMPHDVLPLSLALRVRLKCHIDGLPFDDRFLDFLITNGSRVRESLSDFESEWRYWVEGAEPVPLGLVDDPIIWPSLFATERWAHASSWVTSLVRRSVTTTSIYASPALPLRAIHHEQAAQEAQTRITTGELTGVPRELVSFLFDPRLVRNQGANCTSEIAGQVASFLKGPGDLEPYLG